VADYESIYWISNDGVKLATSMVERVKILPILAGSKSSDYRLLKKISEARRAKIDERRRTLLYVDAKSVECNEAYGSFSAAC
jgi:hypothetical protein